MYGSATMTAVVMGLRFSIMVSSLFLLSCINFVAIIYPSVCALKKSKTPLSSAKPVLFPLGMDSRLNRQTGGVPSFSAQQRSTYA